MAKCLKIVFNEYDVNFHGGCVVYAFKDNMMVLWERKLYISISTAALI